MTVPTWPSDARWGEARPGFGARTVAISRCPFGLLRPRMAASSESPALAEDLPRRSGISHAHAHGREDVSSQPASAARYSRRWSPMPAARNRRRTGRRIPWQRLRRTPRPTAVRGRSPAPTAGAAHERAAASTPTIAAATPRPIAARARPSQAVAAAAHPRPREPAYRRVAGEEHEPDCNPDPQDPRTQDGGRRILRRRTQMPTCATGTRK